MVSSRPGRFTHRERAPSIHWIEDWVEPSAGLDMVSKTNILRPPPPAGNWTPPILLFSPYPVTIPTELSRLIHSVQRTDKIYNQFLCYFATTDCFFCLIQWHAQLQYVWSFTSTPFICFYGVMLNKKFTRGCSRTYSVRINKAYSIVQDILADSWVEGRKEFWWQTFPYSSRSKTQISTVRFFVTITSGGSQEEAFKTGYGNFTVL
jgi:hypothetical protein